MIINTKLFVSFVMLTLTSHGAYATNDAHNKSMTTKPVTKKPVTKKPVTKKPVKMKLCLNYITLLPTVEGRINTYREQGTRFNIKTDDIHEDTYNLEVEMLVYHPVSKERSIVSHVAAYQLGVKSYIDDYNCIPFTPIPGGKYLIQLTLIGEKGGDRYDLDEAYRHNRHNLLDQVQASIRSGVLMPRKKGYIDMDRLFAATGEEIELISNLKLEIPEGWQNSNAGEIKLVPLFERAYVDASVIIK